MFKNFLADMPVDVCSPDDGGRQRGRSVVACELLEVEATGGSLILEEEDELAPPLLEVIADEGDVAQCVVRWLLVGRDESDGVVAATAGRKKGLHPPDLPVRGGGRFVECLEIQWVIQVLSIEGTDDGNGICGCAEDEG